MKDNKDLAIIGKTILFTSGEEDSQDKVMLKTYFDETSSISENGDYYMVTIKAKIPKKIIKNKEKLKELTAFSVFEIDRKYIRPEILAAVDNKQNGAIIKMDFAKHGSYKNIIPVIKDKENE